jgi:ribosomal protein L20
LDGELGYFEQQNEQHKAAQSQLFKASEYEYINCKDKGMKLKELEVILNKQD